MYIKVKQNKNDKFEYKKPIYTINAFWRFYIYNGDARDKVYIQYEEVSSCSAWLKPSNVIVIY